LDNFIVSEPFDLIIDDELREVRYLSNVNRVCDNGYRALTNCGYIQPIKTFPIVLENKFVNTKVIKDKRRFLLLLNNEYVAISDPETVSELLLNTSSTKGIITSEVFFDKESNISYFLEVENNLPLESLVAGGIYRTKSYNKIFLYLGHRLVPQFENHYQNLNLRNTMQKNHIMVYLDEKDLLYKDLEDVFTKSIDSYKFNSIKFNKTKPGKCYFIKKLTEEELARKIFLIKEEAKYHLKQEYIRFSENLNPYIKTLGSYGSRKYILSANIDADPNKLFDFTVLDCLG